MVIPLLSKYGFYILFFTSVVLLMIIFGSTLDVRRINLTIPPANTAVVDIKLTTEAPQPPTIPTVARYLKKDSRINELQDVDGAYSKICSHLGDGVTIVFIITSSPSHVASRNAIRRTWGSFALRSNIAVAFIIGATENEEAKTNLKNEQVLYGDVIRGEFVDSYDNLTLKTAWMLQWVNQFCPKALYTFKTDDDVFVNVDLLLEFIEHKKIKPDRVMYGHLAVKWKPVRNNQSKYYISKDQFEREVFPNFVTGPAYMFSTALSQELYSAGLNLHYIKLEDVFFTGVVADKLNISRTNIPEFTNHWFNISDCGLKKQITVHDLDGGALSYAWYLLNAKC